MYRLSKLSMLFALLLIIALTACASAVTPVLPTGTRTRIIYQGDVLPTALPMPKPNIEGMFEVGGHKMYLEWYGEGSPTIVLEQDFSVGVSAGIWNNVIPYLATETRVCAYDRLNVGASDSLGAHTFAQAADMNYRHEWLDLPPDVTPELDWVWQDVQKEYAALPSDSQFIIADHANRFIQNNTTNRNWSLRRFLAC